MMKISISGQKYLMDKKIVGKYPETRLAKLEYQSTEYVAEKDMYFFDRNPELFPMILDFYRTDNIHIPTGVCSALIIEELDFWGVPLTAISQCCQSKFLCYQNELETVRKVHRVMEDASVTITAKPRVPLLHKFWLFLEDPRTSRAAKIYNGLFLLIVLLSVVNIFLTTHEEIRVPNEKLLRLVYNLSESSLIAKSFNVNNSKQVLFATTVMPTWWHIIDRFLLGFFTGEFILRFMFCPSKCNFIASGLNILDFLLNVSMWIKFYFEQNVALVMGSRVLEVIFYISFCLLSFRLLRFYRIYKQYVEFHVLILSLRDSWKELLLLLMNFIILAALFSNFIFYAEFHEPSTFPTMLNGFWWSVVTLTSVGYGDVVPVSSPGKVVGGMCAVCGLLTLAMPIAIIASKFNEFYQKMKDMQKFKHLVEKRKRKKEKIISNPTTKENP